MADAGARRTVLRRSLARRLLGPVRVRTALGAAAVVAVALAAAGLALLFVIRSSLTHSTQLKAESEAREIASQAATVRHLDEADLPDADEYPSQIVDGTGTVLARSDGLRKRSAPLADFHRPSEPDDDHDDHDDDDDDRGGQVHGKVEFGTVSLPVDDDGEATDERSDTAGHAPFAVAAEKAVTRAGVPVTVYSAAPLAAEQLTLRRTAQTLAIAVPGLLVVVAAVTWLVTGRALGPVEDIRRELAEITAGDLSRRVPVPPARDEVGRLARTTNTTLAALESSADQQRRFVADASHELRSPIASLRTQLEVGRAHPGTLDVDGLLADTVRLQELAADLLTLARLDAGEQPRRDRVDLSGLLREEKARRPGPGAEPSVRFDDPDPEGAGVFSVTGSRPQLARVVVNLLDNARRHAASDIHVVLGHAPGRSGWMLLTVDDDGPGVPEPDRQRIFERFIRLDDARSRDDGGAGLGLAIVRDVVGGHGGTVAVTEAPSGGARFAVRLPAAPSHPPDGGPG